MIKTIFFDIGGVLLNIHPEKTIERLSYLVGISEQDISDSFPTDEHHKYERGEISYKDFFRAVKLALPNSPNLTEAQFGNAWSLMVGEKTKVFDVMNQLTNHYQIWVLSNTNPYHILDERRLEMFDKINGGIFSFEVGFRKPEEGIYLKALEKTLTKANEALFIDDLLENVEAARKLKINVIHFQSFGKLIVQLQKFKIETIEKFELSSECWENIQI